MPETMSDRYQPATDFLSSIDEDWRQHIAAVGPCLHQPHAARDPYESLVRAIAYQQLHARAGDAIIGRLLALFPSDVSPARAIVACDFDQLRGCGFSAGKIATIQGIAQATLEASCRITPPRWPWTMSVDRASGSPCAGLAAGPWRCC
jgi:DNA-3-methyladenine glycosylase II